MCFMNPCYFITCPRAGLGSYSCLNERRRLVEFDVITFQVENTLSTMDKKVFLPAQMRSRLRPTSPLKYRSF
jgi:hypothetical protein